MRNGSSHGGPKNKDLIITSFGPLTGTSPHSNPSMGRGIVVDEPRTFKNRETKQTKGHNNSTRFQNRSQPVTPSKTISGNCLVHHGFPPTPTFGSKKEFKERFQILQIPDPIAQHPRHRQPPNRGKTRSSSRPPERMKDSAPDQDRPPSMHPRKMSKSRS